MNKLITSSLFVAYFSYKYSFTIRHNMSSFCKSSQIIRSIAEYFFEQKNQTPPPPQPLLKRRLALAPCSKTTSPKPDATLPQISWNLFEDIECEGSLTNEQKEQIMEQHLKSPAILDRHPKELINEIFDKYNDGFLLMKGVALVARYLRKKKNLENLYVCTSLEALQNQLNEISKLKEGRFAFVIPDDLEDREEEDKEYKGDAGHKIAVCVEKTPQGVQIAILDALGWSIDPEDNNAPSPKKLRSSAKQAQYKEIREESAILWYIMQSQLYSPETTKIHVSTVSRQHAGYGCETFSLRDAISFLKDRDFFKKIVSDTLTAQENKASYSLQPIIFLPPAFMRGAHSRKLLTSYAEEYSRIFPQHIKEVEALQKKLQESVDQRNEYISYKSYKYHLMALTALLELETQEIEKMISEAGIVAPCKPLLPGYAPQTLSDRTLTRPIGVTYTKNPLLLKPKL